MRCGLIWITLIFVGPKPLKKSTQLTILEVCHLCCCILMPLSKMMYCYNVVAGYYCTACRPCHRALGGNKTRISCHLIIILQARDTDRKRTSPGWICGQIPSQVFVSISNNLPVDNSCKQLTSQRDRIINHVTKLQAVISPGTRSIMRIIRAIKLRNEIKRGSIRAQRAVWITA